MVAITTVFTLLLLARATFYMGAILRAHPVRGDCTPVVRLRQLTQFGVEQARA